MNSKKAVGVFISAHMGVWGGHPNVTLPVSCVSVGGSTAVRPHVEGELWPHPDSSRGWSSAHWAGAETGGPASHALRPLLLERLQEAQRASLWTADIVSITQTFSVTEHLFKFRHFAGLSHLPLLEISLPRGAKYCTFNPIYLFNKFSYMLHNKLC